MHRFVLLAAGLAIAMQSPEPKLSVIGSGVQIYSCAADGHWVFQAPEATLYVDGKAVGTHGKGPSWTWQDGSALTGKVTATTPSPDPAKNIPWLTLSTTPVEGTSGALSDIARVTRTATEGGVAPAAGCDTGRVGETVRVPYSATYEFYLR